MPPLHMLAEVLGLAVAPAAGCAAVALALAVLVGGRRWAPLGAAVGLAGGVGLGLWLRDALTLLPGASAWNRLALAACAVLAAGLLTAAAQTPRWLAWIVRAGTVFAVAWWFVPDSTRSEMAWIVPALAIVVVAQWAGLKRYTHHHPGGAAPLAVGLAAFVAGGVLIHAGSARLTDAATVVSSAVIGMSVVAWWFSLDVSAVLGGPLPYLAGLLLVGHQETFSEIAWPAFALPMLAPLGLAVPVPHPSPRLAMAVRWALLLIPLLIALHLARLPGPIEFE